MTLHTHTELWRKTGECERLCTHTESSGEKLVSVSDSAHSRNSREKLVSVSDSAHSRNSGERLVSVRDSAHAQSSGERLTSVSDSAHAQSSCWILELYFPVRGFPLNTDPQPMNKRHGFDLLVLWVRETKTAKGDW